MCGICVEIVSFVYNIIEVVVFVIVGFLIGSVVLVSWGFDSMVEVILVVMLIWCLKGEKDGVGKCMVLYCKKVVFYVVVCVFWIVVVVIFYEVVFVFIL